MSSQCFMCIFLWVYLFQFMCCVDPGKTPTSGPFKTSIASIQDCSKPTKPYVKNPPVIFLPITHNSTLSGNITFLRDTANMKIRLKGFVQHNGKWEPAYLINNLDCHGIVQHLMCTTMNIKYDRKKCVYSKIRLKGFVQHNGKWEPAYLINNLDCHGIVQHLMCTTMNIKYDRKKCVYSKGSYSFENLNVDNLLHLWISKVQYGHILWRSETYTQAGTFACKEFDTMTEPA